MFFRFEVPKICRERSEFCFHFDGTGGVVYCGFDFTSVPYYAIIVKKRFYVFFAVGCDFMKVEAIKGFSEVFTFS